MSGGAAEIHQSAFSEQENFVTVRERVLIDALLDVRSLRLARVERVDLNFVIEVADVRDDGLIFHSLHVLERDHVGVSGRADVNVAASERVLDRCTSKPSIAAWSALIGSISVMTT